MKFTVKVEMTDRWVPHFLGMLAQMERLGSIGSSRTVSIFSDGDGDFRPRFSWGDMSIDLAPPKSLHDGAAHYDAG